MSYQLLFWVDGLVEVLLPGSHLQLPHGDVELPDEAVVAAPVVVEALNL